MHAFDVLGDPVRRRLLDLLSDPGTRARPAGELAAIVMSEFQISQPAVSKHLKVLRDNGFASVEVDGNRRLYAARPEPLREIDAWLERMAKRPQPVSTPPKPAEQVAMFNNLPPAHRKTWKKRLLAEYRSRA